MAGLCWHCRPSTAPSCPAPAPSPFCSQCNACGQGPQLRLGHTISASCSHPPRLPPGLWPVLFLTSCSISSLCSLWRTEAMALQFCFPGQPWHCPHPSCPGERGCPAALAQHVQISLTWAINPPSAGKSGAVAGHRDQLACATMTLASGHDTERSSQSYFCCS